MKRNVGEVSGTKEDVSSSKSEEGETPFKGESPAVEYLCRMMGQVLARLEANDEERRAERLQTAAAQAHQRDPARTPPSRPPHRRQHDDWGEEPPYDPNWRRIDPRDRIDTNLNSIKMKIPPFKGRNSADDYLEWETKVERIFDCHNYAEESIYISKVFE